MSVHAGPPDSVSRTGLPGSAVPEKVGWEVLSHAPLPGVLTTGEAGGVPSTSVALCSPCSTASGADVLQVPVTGSYTSTVGNKLSRSPPATSTWPEGSGVAVWNWWEVRSVDTGPAAREAWLRLAVTAVPLSS